MIELRWLTRKVPRPRGIDDGIFQPPMQDFIEVRILQYREWPRGTMSSGTLELTWIDVPTVAE